MLWGSIGQYSLGQTADNTTVWQGTAVMAADSAAAFNATRTIQGTVVWAGTSTAAFAATHTPLGLPSLAASGALAAVTLQIWASAATLAGSGALAVNAFQRWAAVATMAAAGALAADTFQKWASAATLAGSGAIALDATHTPQGAATWAASSQVAINISHTPLGAALLSAAGALAANAAFLARLRQAHFRFRTDAGAVDGTPTWGAAEDASTFVPDGVTPFRLRLSIVNDDANNPTDPDEFEIYVSKNAGAYAPVTGSSLFVVAASASSDPNLTPVYVPRLTPP